MVVDFFGGFDSYSKYKDIITGKNSHKSDSNKHDVGTKHDHVVEEIPDSSDFYVLAKTNPDISTNLADNFLNLKQQISNDESNIEINSTYCRVL